MIFHLENVNLLTWFLEQKTPVGIVHQANCFHTMGAGIAKQIAERFPEAFEADKKTKYGDKNKLGTFSFAIHRERPNFLIYNLYGQHEYGRYRRNTSYDALVEGLWAIREDAVKKELTKLGLPYNIGCKLGGGNWAIVKAIIAETFTDPGLDCVICKYEP